MPELPEVETVRRGLEPVLVGRTVTSAVTRRKDLRIPFPDGFAERVSGRKILALRRRAKYLLADLDDDHTLIVHLGMSGRLLWHAQTRETVAAGGFHRPEPAGAPHDHVQLRFGRDGSLVFNDPRRFGLMTLAATDGLEGHALFKHLGPEPLDDEFNAETLGTALAARKTSLKAALLDQRLVVGVGNIYACESLFRAGLSPRRRSDTVRAAQAQRLAAAIKQVLSDAIAAGGSSLKDYVHADGSLGYFQHGFDVYGREGEPCHGAMCDGTPVKRVVQNSRSTFFCPRCQR